jgi:hypothetical protein
MEPGALAIAGIGLALNVLALVIMSANVVSANRRHVQASEERLRKQITSLDVRAAMLEVKMTRAENDIQNVLRALPKRINDIT